MACGATLSCKRSLEFDPVHDAISERSFKRRRCTPCTMSVAVPPTKEHQMNQDIFVPTSSKITSEQIAAHINAQIRWIQKRKQLNLALLSDEASGEGCSSSFTAAAGVVSSHPSLQRENSQHRNVPMFTRRDIGFLCERMIRDKERQLHSEYKNILSSKLLEQYDAFLMFNKDEFHRQVKETAASYVS